MPRARTSPPPATLAAGSLLVLLVVAGCRSAADAARASDAAQVGPATRSSESDPPSAEPLFEEIEGSISPRSDAAPSDGAALGVPARAATTSVIRFGPAPGDSAVPAATTLPASGASASGEDVAASCDALRALRAALLEELRAFRGKKESELPQGERLRKQKLEMKLICIHFLLPPDADAGAVDALLGSLADAADPPGKVHQMLAAGLYHDLDMEPERDRALERVMKSLSPERLALELRNLCFCSEVHGFQHYTPFGRKSLRAGDELIVYGELFQLKSVREENQFVAGIEVSLRLVDEQGMPAYAAPLSPAGGERRRGDSASSENYFFYRFRVPPNLEGSFRCIVEARDLYGGGSAEAEIATRIRK